MTAAATQHVTGEDIRRDGDATICDVCGHPLTSHDPIAERYQGGTFCADEFTAEKQPE